MRCGLLAAIGDGAEQAQCHGALNWTFELAVDEGIVNLASCGALWGKAIRYRATSLPLPALWIGLTSPGLC